MKEIKKEKDQKKDRCTKPGIQGGKYAEADAADVKQEVKELNNVGAPGKQY